MKYTIGIDVGTSGTKTVLFDTLGNALASHTVEYPLYQPKNGYAEQDPYDWANAAFETVTEVIKKSGVDSSDIAGVGLSGQMHGLVMLDSEDRVLRPSIIWCDQRTGEECKLIEELVGKKRLVEITANPALTGFTASKIMWVKRHEPEIFERCAHILLPKDYVRFRLTGKYAADMSDASGMQLLDVANRCWSDEILEKLGIRKETLADLYESPEIAGYITAEAARLTGLREGTPVVAGAGDNAAAAVGVGVVKNGTAFTTIGTSGVVFAHTDEMSIDEGGRVHTFCCAVPNAWHVMGVTQAAGLSLRWLRDTVCTEEISKAESEGTDPYVIMDKLSEESGIGANRLLYLPYLMGERTPHLDPDCRGVFFGLSAIHTRSDMIRAVMEGVCYSQKDSFDILASMGASVSDMRVCGGGAKSALWRQMLADVYGVSCKRTASDEGPALGAAILAMVGAGIYPDVKTACDTVVALRDCCEADAENHKKYGEYHALYKKLYGHLKDDFGTLSKL